MIHLKDMEKIKNIGLTNFDTEHLADLLEEGAPLVSNQVRSYQEESCNKNATCNYISTKKKWNVILYYIKFKWILIKYDWWEL